MKVQLNRKESSYSKLPELHIAASEIVSDETLIFASMEHLEYGNIISPQFPILLVLDVLYAHYLQIDRSKKEALHEYTIQTLQPHLIK